MLKKIDFLLYASMLVFIIILILPTEYRIEIYSPSLIGYLWLLLIPIIIGLLFLSSYLDFKSKKNKIKIIKKILLFIGFVIISIIVWIIQAKKEGNI